MLHIWTLYDLLMNCFLNIQIYIKTSRVRKIGIGELFLVWHFADNFIKGFSRDQFLLYEFDVFLDLLSVYRWEAGLKIKDRAS